MSFQEELFCLMSFKINFCSDAKKILQLSKKPAVKIYSEQKNSSNERKVNIQGLSSESEMEIEFESDHSGFDVSDGNVECLFCTDLFSHDKHSENRLSA